MNINDLGQTIHDEIRKKMKEKNISQKDLAAKMNKSEHAISNLLRRLRYNSGSIESIQNVANGLGLEILFSLKEIYNE